MQCETCKTEVNEYLSAASYDAGDPDWNLCDECARKRVTGIDKPVTSSDDALYAWKNKHNMGQGLESGGNARDPGSC